ncbi:hypothetical protein LLE78_10015, partial [Staphylococcus haemolyticus]|uniref:DUF1381 domain-containing protein n=1 Tax=Staphylococcus haemolyticus TaxID=1283 RepID=UPI001D156477
MFKKLKEIKKNFLRIIKITKINILNFTTIFTILPFFLYSYLSNKILKICLFLIAEVSLSIAITYASSYHYLEILITLLFLVSLFEIAELKIKNRELQVNMISTQNTVRAIKAVDLGVKEGVVKDYIIRVIDNNDEFIEVMQQRINEKFYVIEAENKEEAIEKYKQLKNHSS